MENSRVLVRELIAAAPSLEGPGTNVTGFVEGRVLIARSALTSPQ